MSAFEKLALPIQKWVREQGWSELREVQARAVHAILDGERDLIISANTAGGKTEAAFLPLISRAVEKLDSASPGFDILYIAPLKALINDQYRRLSEVCRHADLPVVPWHGDISASIKNRAQKHPKGILLITPESLEALFVRKGSLIPHLFGGTRSVVVDELHTFLDSERGVQLRSLLTRLELSIGRPVRRIGLSATLGDKEAAGIYLRPGSAEQVELLEAEGGEQELQVQVRGYAEGDKDPECASAIDAISEHLFENLRGSQNLVFAGSRSTVETYADRLRRRCEREHLPQEFYPHHASLSRDHREFVEERLKSGKLPTTAICTSTLELGIDIGEVSCVAQVGAPFTVASLRQRLGRSGRREGNAAVLRQYAVETVLEADSNIIDRLRLGLVRAIAMIELLLERWCEPTKPQALHLSTLVHQILAVIAERGGASAQRLYVTLCEKGPFTTVDRKMFASVLRQLGRAETALIEQSDDGILLLGKTGEKLVEHYSFYAVFMTPEEYRLIAGGKDLGTLPVVNVLAPGMTIIFSGRRWEICELDDVAKVIQVKPSKAGVPPKFGGDIGDIDDRVVEKMKALLDGDAIPIYLDKTSVGLLAEARANFETLGLAHRKMVQTGKHLHVLATWAGTVKTATLALALRSRGFRVHSHDGLLEVDGREADCSIEEALSQLATGGLPTLFDENSNLQFEKFHQFLSTDLLQEDALSSRLNQVSLAPLASTILA